MPPSNDRRFRTVVADPPWRYRDKVHAARVRGVKAANYGFGAEKIRGRRGAEGYYPTMSYSEMSAMPVEVLVAEDAHLYVCTTNAFMEEAHALARAWGFTPRTILTWVKPGIGMGSYFRNNTEHVVFAVRGRLAVLRHNQPTAFVAAKTKRHSEKPAALFAIVESMSPGPYLELFARAERSNWVTWGNECPGPRELEKLLDWAGWKKSSGSEAVADNAVVKSLDSSKGYCLSCREQLTRCGVAFSGKVVCPRCGAINLYENSQQPASLVAPSAATRGVRPAPARAFLTSSG